MFELNDIVDEFESDTDIAHQTCVLLSLVSPVPESFFRLYTAHLGVDPTTLFNAVSYFRGCKKLDIACDCSKHDSMVCDLNPIYIEYSSFYEEGTKAMVAYDGHYSRICNEISSLSAEIFNG